jgi:hypothetical protein
LIPGRKNFDICQHANESGLFAAIGIELDCSMRGEMGSFLHDTLAKAMSGMAHSTNIKTLAPAALLLPRNAYN